MGTTRSRDSIQRVRGGLTSGLFNVNKSSQGGSSLLAPFESSVYQFGFDASWEIDSFAGHRRALGAATADVRAVCEARRDTLVSLLAEVARNYSELRRFQRRLDITNQNINLQQDSLHLTRVRADAGLGTQFDVERQTAQLEFTRALVPTLEAAEIQTIHRLCPWPFPETCSNAPDVGEAEMRVAAETARVGVARADLFPKILLSGAVGRQGTEPSG